jgi:hypothetical protein
MKEMKTYTMPVLTIHGNVEAITQEAHAVNNDVPSGGNGNSAYS